MDTLSLCLLLNCAHCRLIIISDLASIFTHQLLSLVLVNSYKNKTFHKYNPIYSIPMLLYMAYNYKYKVI